MHTLQSKKTYKSDGTAGVICFSVLQVTHSIKQQVEVQGIINTLLDFYRTFGLGMDSVTLR